MKMTGFKIRYQFAILCIALLLSSLLIGCSNVNAHKLRVGLIDDHKPWEYKDEQGKAAGISIDLATAFGESQNRKVEFIWLERQTIFDALREGQIDMILSSMTIDKDLLTEFDISDPYTKIYPILLIRQSSPLVGKNQLDHSTVKLSVVADTQTEVLVRSSFSSALILSYNDRKDGLSSLTTQNSDALVDDPLSILTLYQTNPPSFRINPAPLTDNFQYYVAYFNKNQKDTKDDFNKFLMTSRRGGFFDTLEEKYLQPLKVLMDYYQISLNL